MPFSSDFDDIYRLGIKDPADNLGIRAERVDEQLFAGGILDRIYRQIEAADVVIADMSGRNPNVFYLAWARNEIENIRRSRIRVQVKEISGDLERTDWFATAKITFRIDLHNDSDLPSAEIESIYFYTGREWEIRQDEKGSPSTESDMPQYKWRHFLTCPVKRLQRTGWAQLRFEARRIVASKLRGGTLQESYQVTGRSMLRLVTDSGMFDYEISIDTVADEIPF